ncbi:hypothetical protein [Formosa sp. PL04]|uniref:hypothetical protein n=1 Tax=Formosa sp. PL04 TaxID=3081755 RepID=UPI002981D0D6|nr:hypothetical protein [Formosa sp. PL04]MDW5288256.1 hypothetical protein [Formosa sp. PL04]
MKLLTYILAFMVISLSVKTGNADVLLTVETQKSCCSLKSVAPSNNKDSEHKNENQSNNTCNPFQACCSCLLICFNFPFSPVEHIDISTEQFFGYQSFLASQFISDFWQPPQTV